MARPRAEDGLVVRLLLPDGVKGADDCVVVAVVGVVLVGVLLLLLLCGALLVAIAVCRCTDSMARCRVAASSFSSSSCA